MKLVRRLLIAALAVIVVIGAKQRLTTIPDPYAGFQDNAEERLRERFAEYSDLRMNERWAEVYLLVHPDDRGAVDLTEFVKIFGTGVLKTREINLESFDIDFETHTAIAKMDQVGELNVAKLPAIYRNSLRVDDPNDLVRRRQVDMNWAWRDGDWYYRLDDEVRSGKRITEDGEEVPIEPIDVGQAPKQEEPR